MEVAASLSQLGLEVTLVHRGEGLFEILRARPLAVFLSELYGRKGVQLLLGDEVASFGGRSRVDAVETKRGRTAQAELVVVGVGVAPNTAWLEGSGLRLDDGIVVNERFETGVDGIWAVGDVARFYDPLFDKHRRIEHWSNANYAGAEVGRLMAGGDGGFDIVSTFFSEVFGISIKVFGDVDEFDEIVFRGSIDGSAIGFYLRGDRLVACLVLSQDEETENRLKELLKARATVRDAERLGDDGVALDELFSA
jgi:NADPH-dependent 2,4-dienoyl-CoA reductase/sulfur reductase-like enzyme